MIIVTGGSGFIGTHLCKKISQGAQVANLDAAPPKESFGNNYSYKKVDLLDAAGMEAACRGASAIFHLAAQTSVQKSIENPALDWKVNVDGTKNCLEACRKNDVGAFVFASSAAIYGTPVSVPVSETHPKNPLSPYGKSKLEADSMCEKYSRDYGLKTIRLRFFNVYGFGQDPKSSYSGVITKFCERLKVGKAPIVFGQGAQTRDFVHVGDVVEACLACSNSDNTAGKAYNIGSGKEITVLELAKVMIKISGREMEPEFQPALAGEIDRSVAEISAARKDFGFEAKVSLEGGLRGLLAKNS